MANTKRITGTLPAATIAQRLAAMSDVQLAQAAAQLARNPEHDALCTSVLEALEARIPADTFAAFVAEIYGEVAA
jgi:hypothetical protein